MKAVVVDRVNSVSVQEVPYPELKDDEVIIQVMASGLCGTDMAIFTGGYPADYPLIPGHEFSGIVHKVGKSVTRWKPGDRVSADPNKYCGECYYCLSEQGNMCENAIAIGVTRDGGFAEYVAVPDTNVFLLPDDLSFSEAAFLEPLSCSVYAMHRLALPYGSRCLIVGAGSMGLLLLKNLRTGGAAEVVCMDLVQERLDIATELGAYATARSFEELDEYVAHAGKFDAVIDATGQPQVIQKMFDYAGKRAKILQFGCAGAEEKIEISPFDLYDNDWEYIGTRANCFTFNEAVSLMRTGAITAKEIINDYVDLEQIAEYLQNGVPSGSLKVVAQPNKE